MRRQESSRERSVADFRVKVDDSDKSPGWKFSESGDERNPGPCRDSDRRISRQVRLYWYAVTPMRRSTVALSEIAEKVDELLETIQHDMYERAKAHRDAHTYDAHNYRRVEGYR